MSVPKTARRSWLAPRRRLSRRAERKRPRADSFGAPLLAGRGRKGIVAGDGEDRRMAMLDDALTDLRRSLSNGSTRARLTARNVGTYWACAGRDPARDLHGAR